jgi:hypothetical protein
MAPSTTVPISNSVDLHEEDEDTTRLSLSDTDSTMTKPELPMPHKHQLSVLIIGMCEFLSWGSDV